MSENENVFERLLKLWTLICKMIMDGLRDANKVAETLQMIADGACEPDVKFTLLADFGIITVPDDYNHSTWLASHTKLPWERCKWHIYSDPNAITDEKFQNPSYVMKPGEKFRVQVFRHLFERDISSEECMVFLMTQGAVFTNIQGLLLLKDWSTNLDNRSEFAKKWSHIRRNWSLLSFDDKDHLPPCGEGRHHLPDLLNIGVATTIFELGLKAKSNSAILCFTKSVE